MSALGALPVPVGRRQPTSQRQAPVCRVHQADMGLLAQHRIHELRTTVGRIEVRHQVEHAANPPPRYSFPRMPNLLLSHVPGVIRMLYCYHSSNRASFDCSNKQSPRPSRRSVVARCSRAAPGSAVTHKANTPANIHSRKILVRTIRREATPPRWKNAASPLPNSACP
jgi:hypothetical protein